MKRFFILFILFVPALLLWPSQSPAQTNWSDWVWQNPLPVGDGLGSIRFVSPGVGWITTGAGQLLYTDDAGATWTIQTPDAVNAFGTVLDPNGPASSVIAGSGWVIGIQGGFANASGPALYKTTNSGAAWVSQPVGAGVAGAIFGIGVQFINATTGWATVAAGTFPSSFSVLLRKSTDGGSSWSTIYTAPPTNVVLSFQFLDAFNGFAIMDSLDATFGELVPPTSIIRTTDGGATWNPQLVDPTPGVFNALHFQAVSTGWVVGDSTKIFRTTNGGTNWSAVTNTGIPAGFRCRAVVFVLDIHGWIAADDQLGNKSLVHTTNDGVSWTPQNSGLNASVLGIHFGDGNNGWLAADFGEIAHTTNGGANWTPQFSSVTSAHLHGAAMLPGDIARAWAVGDFGTILRTVNGGTSWTSQNVTPNTLRGVSFTSPNVGYAAGDNNTVLKTTDGGSNWGGVSPLSPFTNFTAVDFVNDTVGTVVGNSGNTFRTTDGGGTWAFSVAGGPNLNGVSFVDAANGWAVGVGGAVYWTVDSGKTWISQSGVTAENLNAVSFVDATTGWAVGDSGTILGTANAGINWNPQTSGTTNNLRGVFFTDASNGTAVGDEGTILHTTDGGATWQNQSSGSDHFLSYGAVAYSGATSAAIVGDFGSILHFGLVGTDAPRERQNRPVEFQLSQNYPNPFNPATSIRFSLSKRQKITLEIFNLIGERVKLLANEEKAAGEHTVVWDGRDDKGRTLSSGVYFYRLRGEDFTESKRKIFLK